VILASNYNPSIVSKDWLSQKGILTGTVANFVHTPVFALIETEMLLLTVDEQRLQIMTKRITENNLKESANIALRIVTLLPETPYKALGLNYHFVPAENKCDLRRILSPQSEKLAAIFSADYHLGATISFSFDDFLVTSVISPSLPEGQPSKVSFNFHSIVGSAEEIGKLIAKQPAVIEKASTIVEELCNNE